MTPNCTPESAPPAPDSKTMQWAPCETRTSSPGRVCTDSAIWFAMVPEGT